jgi:hypothetical protein
MLIIILSIALLFLDVMLVILSRKGFINRLYKSAILSNIKHSIRYGSPWDTIRITQIMDTVYFNTLLLLGVSYFYSIGNPPYSLVLFVFFPGAVFLSIILTIQRQLKKKINIIHAIPALIHASFVSVGFAGSCLYFHEQYGGTVENIFLYLFIIPITNMLFRKKIMIDQRKIKPNV